MSAGLYLKLGGEEQAIEKMGNRILPGFTAPKILWLKRNEPQNFSKLRHILLPHDYLNYYLTGEMFMEYGDASGTAIMDIRSRSWSREVIEVIDPCIEKYLPALSSSSEPCGNLRPEICEKYGLSRRVVVSAGGGDNMMGAIGTGNVLPGWQPPALERVGQSTHTMKNRLWIREGKSLRFAILQVDICR